MEQIEPIGMTVSEAAAALRISEPALYRLLKTGAIRAAKLPNRCGWRIHPDSLHEFVRNGGVFDGVDNEE